MSPDARRSRTFRSVTPLAHLGGFVTSLLCASACLEPRESSSTITNSCTECHGSATRTGTEIEHAAPPSDLRGNTARSERGVGAHQSHLTASETHRAVACEECHTVPSEVSSPGHADTALPAELTFGPLARTGGRNPSYDPATATCQSTYCHSPSNLVGSSPAWTSSSRLACTGCHGAPPAPPHPQYDRCEVCHGATVTSRDSIANPALHANGVVEVRFPDSCSACHGTGALGEPPPALDGRTSPSARGVGAHVAHFSGGVRSRPVTCGDCHSVPGTVDAPGHLNGLPALVRLSGLAGNSGATPSYDGNNCANTYCHGGLGTWGGSHTAPSWTATDGSASACGSCHALVPPLPHPAVADWPIARLPEGCWLSGCHANLGDDYAFIDRMLHINGKVDLLAAP